MATTLLSLEPARELAGEDVFVLVPWACGKEGGWPVPAVQTTRLDVGDEPVVVNWRRLTEVGQPEGRVKKGRPVKMSELHAWVNRHSRAGCAVRPFQRLDVGSGESVHGLLCSRCWKEIVTRREAVAS